MSIDPLRHPELFADVQRTGLFGSQVPPEQVMRNVMRQQGIAYSPSNPVTQYLMRMAPALMQSYYLTQAQAGALPGGGLPGDPTGVMDFFTQGLGQGRNLISSALQTLPDFIKGIRAEGVPDPEDLSPVLNSYRNVLRRELADPGNVMELFGTLQSPFLSAKNAQLAEQGRAMVMGDIYGEAAGRGQDIIDYLFGAKPAPKPFDLAPMPGPTAGVPALPAPGPGPTGVEPTPRLPWGGIGSVAEGMQPGGPLVPMAGPTITDEDRQILDEVMLTPEEQRERKRLQLKPGVSPTIRG